MTTPSVVGIEGVVRDYAWGSTTAIQQLLGSPVDGRPAAELWLGAHPDDPAGVPEHGTTLDELIARDPAWALGDAVLAHFGPRLPFLLKVLAADTALSIQVHPTIVQARAGHAREDAAGVPRDAPNRSYRDPNHKPELLCALTEFEALCGFRPVPVIRDVLAALALPELDFLADALDADDPLRAAFTAVLTHPEPGVLSRAVAERAAATCCAARAWPPRTFPATSASWSRCCSTTCACSPARRSSSRPATSTRTCAAPAWRSWPTATTCCAAA